MMRFGIVHITLVVFSLCLIRAASSVVVGTCNFPMRESLEPKALALLQKVLGSSYETGDLDYSYVLTVCGTIPGLRGAAALQTQRTGSSVTGVWILGNLSNADIRYSDEWIMLTFSGGDKYPSACGQEERQTSLMIMCDPGEEYGSLHFLHEEARNNKSTDCSYLFELDHAALCSVEMSSSCQSLLIAGMSVGTILIISFFSLLAAYCLLGVAYRHFMLGATGIQKLPNHEFWRDFGELQADGCDFVCRAGNMSFVPLSVTAEEQQTSRTPADYSTNRQTATTQQPGPRSHRSDPNVLPM